MVKRIIATVAFVFVSVYMFAQYPTLTNRAKVVLFSCGPGPELYAGFGHSALWVSDDSLHIDRLYNYGTFDFDTPNFYGKFIRGKLDYMLSVTRASRFIAEYDQRKIAVDGQELMLSPAEKQRIFEFLENNLLPENRFYKYDFFYDNCATRIRDVLVKVVDGKVDFNTPDLQISFREMLFPYLTHTPWTKFGINLILGLTSDKKATPWDYMYLPDFLRDEFQQATIISNGTERKLVEEKKQYLPSGLDLSNRKMDDPVVVFSLILLVIVLLTYIECKKKKEFRFVDSFLFGISVLAGLFLLFMWVGTDHIATAKNMNVLWLLPAQLLFLVTRRMDSLLGKKLNTIALIYQTLVAFILLLWPQDSEISFTLISLVFVVRIFGSMWRKK